MFPSGKLFPRIRADSVAARDSGANRADKPYPNLGSSDQAAEHRGVPRETAPFPRLTAPARMSFRAAGARPPGRGAPARGNIRAREPAPGERELPRRTLEPVALRSRIGQRLNHALSLRGGPWGVASPLRIA